ncbi:transmembrane protein 145-like [Trichogramma pretiosum]|uniref:transmembrane protein 145-like n=1 Tax=Trichogramma pretiosum TaxID=7493 RepID=UPI000C71B4F0|nr:transmembrane protein 145-like [Trichogramma pretiosum]
MMHHHPPRADRYRRRFYCPALESSLLVLVALAALRIGSPVADAKILSGHLTTYQNWAFLARFCFLSEKGRFQYDFIIHNKYTEANLLLYYDSPQQWPAVYPSNKTCLERESVLRRDLGQIVSLSPHTSYTQISGCYFTHGTDPATGKNESEAAVRCSSYREFRSARPRWWFIALSDCHSDLGLNVSYWISLTNAEPGNFWREHFSADEFYILPELIVGSAFYVVLFGLSIYVAAQLKTRRLLHVTYKLFMMSLLTQLWGLLFQVYSYVTRALYGYDLHGFHLAGNLLEAVSETCFTSLLLLMSLGYTVTKSVLTPVQSWRLSLFIGLTVSLQLLLFIYQAEAFDPGLVLYLYESPPGYGLIALRIWAWVVFVACCYKTSKAAAAKFHFYGSLLSLGSAWFLCQPLVVITMTFFVDKWVRESVVKGFSLWVVFVGHCMFLYVTRPSTANSNFPFHIRTFQVVPIAGEGQGNSYEPNGRSPHIVMRYFTVTNSQPMVSTIT